MVTLPIALCAVTRAQATQPGGPAASVREFQRAMDGENPKAVSRILLATDTEQQTAISEMHNLAESLSHLRQATQQAFGARAASLFNQSRGPVSEKIDADSATVATADGKILHLRKVHGQWRIPLEQLAGEQLKQRVAELRVISEAINRIAEETRAGRFDNADEVVRAVQEELMNAGPTTAPAAPKTRG